MGLLERWRLTHVGCTELVYNRIYPDDRRASRTFSTAYMGLYPESEPSRGFLKDGGSPMLEAWSQPIMGYTLMVA